MPLIQNFISLIAHWYAESSDLLTSIAIDSAIRALYSTHHVMMATLIDPIKRTANSVIF